MTLKHRFTFLWVVTVLVVATRNRWCESRTVRFHSEISWCSSMNAVWNSVLRSPQGGLVFIYKTCFPLIWIHRYLIDPNRDSIVTMQPVSKWRRDFKVNQKVIHDDDRAASPCPHMKRQSCFSNWLIWLKMSTLLLIIIHLKLLFIPFNDIIAGYVADTNLFVTNAF